MIRSRHELKQEITRLAENADYAWRQAIELGNRHNQTIYRGERDAYYHCVHLIQEWEKNDTASLPCPLCNGNGVVCLFANVACKGSGKVTPEAHKRLTGVHDLLNLPKDISE